MCHHIAGLSESNTDRVHRDFGIKGHHLNLAGLQNHVESERQLS